MAWPFEQGLAMIRVGGKYGFIDRQAKLVVAPQFDGVWLGTFKQGLASVRIGDDKTGKWGFIDKHGRFAINPAV
jgi:hypothetical protein